MKNYFKSLILILLLATSIGCNKENPINTPEKADWIATGDMYYYLRHSTPEGIKEEFDTIPAQINVKTTKDSIFFTHFINGALKKSCAFLISDSIQKGHNYYISTYRPIESYSFYKGIVRYDYSVSDPTSGPYLYKEGFAAKGE